jgi:hypothetical protein
VEDSMYDSLKPHLNSLTVVTRPGWLGFEWVASISLNQL